MPIGFTIIAINSRRNIVQTTASVRACRERKGEGRGIVRDGKNTSIKSCNYGFILSLWLRKLRDTIKTKDLSSLSFSTMLGIISKVTSQSIAISNFGLNCLFHCSQWTVDIGPVHTWHKHASCGIGSQVDSSR